MIDLTV